MNAETCTIPKYNKLLADSISKYIISGIQQLLIFLWAICIFTVINDTDGNAFYYGHYNITRNNKLN